MLNKKRVSAIFGGLVILVLSVIGGLVRQPATAQAQGGCAALRTAAVDGTPRWLEGCGRVDPKADPETAARQALAAEAARLGLRADGRDLQLQAVVANKAATYVRFNQVYQGVPVYLGQVLVQYNRAGEVQLINNHTRPNLTLAVTPTVDGDTAEATALAQVPGSDHLPLPPQRELMIYGEGNQPELAWHFSLHTMDRVGDWQVLVSAQTGGVLGAWNAIRNDGGTGLVYNPNPIQQSGDTGLTDNMDATSPALDNARVNLSLTDLFSNTTKLRGSYADLTAPGVIGCFRTPSYTPGQADSATRVYNYDRSQDAFEEVTVYAAITGVQHWFQSLGFTNVNNRSIPANAHCDNSANAYYSPMDGALHFGDGGFDGSGGGVDFAEDGDVVVHEYGHAVQDNQVPGWGPPGGTTGSTEQRAMGEGFGDFLAGMYYLNQGDPTYLASRRYCIAEWVDTNFSPGTGCLRWINGRDEATGNDIGLYSGTPGEEHDDGRYWSAALTCIYEGVGANATARDQVMQLVLQHHFSLVPDTSNNAFENAVDALRLADLNLFGGANQSLIIGCAQARGLIAQPKLFAPTITTPTDGASFPISTTTSIHWDTNGAPATTTYRLEYEACQGIFNETVEKGLAGWTTQTTGAQNWTQVTDQAHSPTHSWFAADESTASEKFLVSPSIAISGSAELIFWHRYDLELTYDGGVVEASTNGNSWSDLGPKMTTNGYPTTISSISGSPIAGRPAFSGRRTDWIETRADLSDFAGQSVQLRFREANDAAVNKVGWWVDDIRVIPVSWTLLATTTVGTTSYDWTPAAPIGQYCLRLRGVAPGYNASDYSPIRLVTLTKPPAVYLPLITRP